MVKGITLQDYERAEVEIRTTEERRSFYIHAAVFVLVNRMLMTINLVFVPTLLVF